MSKWMIGTICLLLSSIAAGERLQSTNQRTQLIELYTSEGCSSCPPADRWLSAFKEDERLWREIIPIALHVDYWDYIGWQDPFAQPGFARRQRDYVAHGQVSQVYTPGIIVDGKEWRSWFRTRGIPPYQPIATGVLSLETDAGTFKADYSDDDADILHIVWLGFELSSQVSSGENHGKNLQHDFVVLGHKAYRGKSSWSGKLPPRQATTAPQAIAAWVSTGPDPAPLQAVGGWHP